MSQSQFFKRSLTGLNSEFSFSLTSCLTKAEEPSLPYYLPIAGGRIIGFIPFPRVLVLSETLSSNFTLDLVSYNLWPYNNHAVSSPYQTPFRLPWPRSKKASEKTWTSSLEDFKKETTRSIQPNIYIYIYCPTIIFPSLITKHTISVQKFADIKSIGKTCDNRATSFLRLIAECYIIAEGFFYIIIFRWLCLIFRFS